MFNRKTALAAVLTAAAVLTMTACSSASGLGERSSSATAGSAGGRRRCQDRHGGPRWGRGRLLE